MWLGPGCVCRSTWMSPKEWTDILMFSGFFFGPICWFSSDQFLGWKTTPAWDLGQSMGSYTPMRQDQGPGSRAWLGIWWLNQAPSPALPGSTLDRLRWSVGAGRKHRIWEVFTNSPDWKTDKILYKWMQIEDFQAPYLKLER